jgi:translation initiation factor IF-3
MDLVEVAPQAQPPVCRLLDYGKFRYEQTKKERESRKHAKTAEVGEVRMRPRISKHDMQVRVRTIKKLLEEGDKVKVSIVFRGREVAHPELGMNLMKKVLEEVKEEAVVEKPAGHEGRNLVMILGPLARKPAARPAGPHPVEPAIDSTGPTSPTSSGLSASDSAQSRSSLQVREKSSA